ncbi:MAG TPA: alkaline phosphatase, partial [Chthoniobacterales bacterium]
PIMEKKTSLLSAIALAATALTAATAFAAPTVSRLTPPSALFSFGDKTAPFTARFLPGQRFDIQATISPDAGETLGSVTFKLDGKPIDATPVLTDPTVAGLLPGTKIATLRAISVVNAGVHTFSVVASQTGGQSTTQTGNFEIVPIKSASGGKANNVIIMIGDGMGIAHRTAARIMSNGILQGKAISPLAMDTFPYTAMVLTSSLNSIVTDSSPGASCYSTGNKGNNNQHGVFPDDTTEKFDNPRVESITEYFHRTQGKAAGIVTTADVFDATPGAFGSHTQDRGAGTGIVDQYLDDRSLTGLSVLLGGGRKWFLPQGTPGSARTEATDYVLPADLTAAWGAQTGAIDPTRDLIADFETAGFAYAPTRAELVSNASNATKLLGLFSFSNMNVAKDKIDGRRGTSTVVNDYGFPNQPMLDEMTDAALKVLSKSKKGFILMVEGASIDKQAHNMDTERFIIDTIEFDKAIARAKKFAKANPDTLVIVTADHECSGASVIGASLVTNADLATRAASGGGVAQLRTGVVGNYETAGFPIYEIQKDGYPVTTDIDHKMLIGYAANADRYEDWLTNAKPIRDSQQPFNNVPPLSNYPSGPLVRDVAGNFLITGQVNGSTAVHTANDIPLSAYGAGAAMFHGSIDNTDVFFKAAQAAIAGTASSEL